MPDARRAKARLIGCRRPSAALSAPLAVTALAAACAACVSTVNVSTDTDWSWKVPGRIVLVAAIDDPDRPRNAAQAQLAGTSQVVPLWEADAEISDWLPSPDGRQVVYREVWHYVPKTEALVVRALTPGATARYVVMGEPELGRLAGQVWSPTSDALAYGKQVGHVESFSGAGGTRRWEMRVVTVGAAKGGEGTAGDATAAYARASTPTAEAANDGGAPPDIDAALDDRRVFALDGATLGTHVYTLVAWSPALSRAVVLETPGGGGGRPALRVYDTADGRLVARVAPGGADPRVAAAPDGTRVAWLSADAGIGTIDVATGRWRAIDPVVESGYTPVGVAWSADGRWLGWAVAFPEAGGASGRSGETAQGLVTVSAQRITRWPWRSGLRRAWIDVDGADGALGLFALSPGGEVALVTDVRSDGRTVARTAALTNGASLGAIGPDGTRMVAEHRLPPGTWGVGWWP